EFAGLKVRRGVPGTHGQNASAEYFFIVASRSLDVGDGEKMCDSEALLRWHLIAFLLDLYLVHSTPHNAFGHVQTSVTAAACGDEPRSRQSRTNHALETDASQTGCC